MSVHDWDARLMTPERAIKLAGDHRLVATYEVARLSQFEMEGGGLPLADRPQINIRCFRCGQSVAELGFGDGRVGTTLGELLSGVLRHLVMAHDLPLSGAGKGNDG